MIRVFVKKKIRNNLLDLEKEKYFRYMITARLYKQVHCHLYIYLLYIDHFHF